MSAINRSKSMINMQIQCEATSQPVSPNDKPGANAAAEAPMECSGDKPDHDICFLHSCPVEFWCFKCQVATCSNCISEPHYAHGQISLKNLVGQESFVEEVKSSLIGELGQLRTLCLEDTLDLCDKGLEFIASIKPIENELLSWKKHLQHQQMKMSASNFMETSCETTSKAGVDAFLKVMSLCDVEGAALASKFSLNKLKLYAIDADFKSLHRNQETQIKRLLPLPEEFLCVDAKIVLDIERSKMERIRQTVQRSKIETMTVMSSERKPILNLSELLLKLYEEGCGINLYLLDTFFGGSSGGTNDSVRLKLFLHREFGERLASFYGHLKHAAWAKFGVVGLPKLGLHLQSGGDLADIKKILNDNSGAETGTEPSPGEASNCEGASSSCKSRAAVLSGPRKVVSNQKSATVGTKAPFVADIAISKSVIATDITKSLEVEPNRKYRLHLVKLEDPDKDWCCAVMKALLPRRRYDFDRVFVSGGEVKHELWIHEWGCLSPATMREVRQYLADYTSIQVVRVNVKLFTQDQQEIVNAPYAETISQSSTNSVPVYRRLPVQFSIPPF
ncbi:uncharacterized protein LOC108677031 [Hyalella azteca]|uniref:Uncharacterized protein LOC108677031 n=1 Tax=Hyalella azteca TaxID=294128 RepID=A0A979FMB2_HYAAZ|nr:uncharacterized protein LOC108677031 [Hyalella azteca]